MTYSLAELAAIQRRLRKKVTIVPFEKPYRYLLGIDSSYSKTTKSVFSVAVLYDLLKKEVVEYASAVGIADFPYIPGYLSFRELPTTLETIKAIKHNFDIILVDGQGIAHPRGFGFASHLGVVLDSATIGCAKKHLLGDYGEVENKKGAYSFLYIKGEPCGVVLRTKENTKPIFVSPGHKCDIFSATKIVMESLTKYRLPEPIRLAHQYSKSKITAHM